MKFCQDRRLHQSWHFGDARLIPGPVGLDGSLFLSQRFWLAEQALDQPDLFLAGQCHPAQAILSDHFQIAFLLAGDECGGQKGFAQGHRLKEHIGSGLAHHQIGAGHPGRNCFGKGEDVTALVLPKAPLQKLVCARGQDQLQGGLAVTICLGQQTLHCAGKAGAAFAAALQKNCQTLPVEASFCPGPLCRRRIRRVELAAGGPADQMGLLWLYLCRQCLGVDFPAGRQVERCILHCQPGRVQGAGVRIEQDKGHLRGDLLHRIGEEGIGGEDGCRSLVGNQRAQTAADQPAEKFVGTAGPARCIGQLEFRAPQPERVATDQLVMAVNPAGLGVDDTACKIFGQKIGQRFGQAYMAAAGFRSKDQQVAWIVHCWFDMSDGVMG